MKIVKKDVIVKELFDGYSDKDDDGVVAFHGNLNIRPPYQREFVYDDKRAEAVIQTALNGFPLNVMYWFQPEPGKYEILDGQQRTLSIMRFLDHKFDIELNGHRLYVDGLPDDKYEALINYPLMVYVCDGTSSEKLSWFSIVNEPGLKLTPQELRNSVYTGPWLSDAKYHFSKRKCAAQNLSARYVKGDPNRQELLEVALEWISEAQNLTIEGYMAKHQTDNDADELWQYFQDVIAWIKKIFPKYYEDMKGIKWGHLYYKYGKNPYNSSLMAKEEEALHKDQDVQKKSGIYEYLLSKDDDPFAGRLLNLRDFSDFEKQTQYEKQEGFCAICHKHFPYSEMEGDHIKPWSKGGHTTPDNLQMICRSCNAKKGNKY